MVFLVVVAVLTAFYVIGMTTIFKDRYNYFTIIKTTDSSLTVKMFGPLVYGDIGIGTSTAVGYVTQDAGGSGTFYYAVAFLKIGERYVNSNPIFLGDRIAPQTVNIQNGVALFNYCDRKPEEPFTTQPSVCFTRGFSIENGSLVEIPR